MLIIIDEVVFRSLVLKKKSIALSRVCAHTTWSRQEHVTPWPIYFASWYLTKIMGFHYKVLHKHKTFPFGFYSKVILEIFSSSLLETCPIPCHFLNSNCFQVSCWFTLSLNSTFDIILGHYILKLNLRLLYF